MAIHRRISAEEPADRPGAQRVGRCVCPLRADRRDAKGQMALFTEAARFVVHMDTKSDIPSHELQGRDALAPAFHNLNQYDATTHFNGQNTVVLDGPEA